MTKHLHSLIVSYLNKGFTLKEISLLVDVHPSIVKSIDRQRLQALYAHQKPQRYSRHIAIDEFLLYKGHRYATIVIDLDTGEVLFCEEGKKKQQVFHFIQTMGHTWMRQVKAVSMDMNAQYDSAFKQWAPHVNIVYDLFHVVKLYNDKVITTMRRRKQRELLEAGDMEGYRLFKGSRFLLTASRSTLERKDKQASENNRHLATNYHARGLSLPPGERIMRTGNEAHLDKLLAANQDFSAAYILLEQLKLAFKQEDEQALSDGMKLWLKLARQSKSQEILSFADTIEKRLDGILNHANYPISSGKLEGTNNLIKTIRRKAYGLPDTQYFFWKIMDASRKPYTHYKSHKILR
jgi:transposase